MPRIRGRQIVPGNDPFLLGLWPVQAVGRFSEQKRLPPKNPGNVSRYIFGAEPLLKTIADKGQRCMCLNVAAVGGGLNLNFDIQTHRKFKTTLFIVTKHNMRIFGTSPQFKVQNNT